MEVPLVMVMMAVEMEEVAYSQQLVLVAEAEVVEVD